MSQFVYSLSNMLSKFHSANTFERCLKSKVQNLNRCRAFRQATWSPRDPRGGQTGKTKTNNDKGYFSKLLFYACGSIKIEAGGDQKAPQGPPRTKPNIEEQTKTNKKGQKGHQNERRHSLAGGRRDNGGAHCPAGS